MLDRGASYILCKRGALHEAMRSVGRVGVRAARQRLASVLRALAQLSRAHRCAPNEKTTRGNLSKGLKD